MAGIGTGDREYMNGYEHGRMLCLTKGLGVIEQWLRENAQRKGSFYFGAAAALWDYEDANGLPHSSRPRAATRRRDSDAS